MGQTAGERPPPFQKLDLAGAWAQELSIFACFSLFSVITSVIVLRFPRPSKQPLKPGRLWATGHGVGPLPPQGAALVARQVRIKQLDRSL